MTNTPIAKRQEAAPLPTIRWFLLLILLMESVGVVAELLMLEHFEEPYQWIPFGLVGLELLVLGWWAFDKSALCRRVFQVTMLLFMLSGAVGGWMHYESKVEFQLEWQPDLAGMELFKTAMLSPTPPSLAPGAMIQMGLLGLVYVYRYPTRRKAG